MGNKCFNTSDYKIDKKNLLNVTFNNILASNLCLERNQTLRENCFKALAN